MDVRPRACTATTIGDLIAEVAGLIHSGSCSQAANRTAAVNEDEALTEPSGG